MELNFFFSLGFSQVKHWEAHCFMKNQSYGKSHYKRDIGMKKNISLAIYTFLHQDQHL